MARPTMQMYTHTLATGPMATTPTSAPTEMEADMYFCITWNTISRKSNTGVRRD